MELVPSQKFYKGIYKAHADWIKYLKRKDKEILCSEMSLEKVKNYELIKNMK